MRSNPRPEFCPNLRCRHHTEVRAWRYKKKGFYTRSVKPQRIQRYICLQCKTSFSDQTFQVSYWCKKPQLLGPVFYRILSCSAYRQIAREFQLSPTTVLRLVERLGRHCLLFHELHRPREISETLVIDGFETFEYSQYYPTHFHLAVGQASHFFFGFTDSELRRKGRMRKAQKRRRHKLEASLGRPDPKSIEKEMATLLEIVVLSGKRQKLHSDEHRAYPRALRRLSEHQFEHKVTSSKKPRTSTNPLFPVNLIDLLIRHTGSNHKRETIAFSKRRQSAAERLAVFLVWRNYMKRFSERKRKSRTPAQKLGLFDRLLTLEDILGKRLFPKRIALPERWRIYYRHAVPTRALPRLRAHTLKYAY